MASTEQRTGFRLPWGSPSTDANASATPADQSTEAPPATSTQQETDAMATPVADDGSVTQAAAPVASSTDVGQGTSSQPEAGQQPAMTEQTPASPSSSSFSSARGAASRQPTRFLADLVRAMRATAEDNRNTLVEGLRNEGKGSVERIHARSAEEVESLRRVADDDLTGIKDWSKNEIARIRTETEERIAERKQELELSLEGHAALIEREIEHVQARIAEYEAQMDRFLVRLDEIDDPAEFASFAAEMPEPPSLEEATAAARAAALEELIRETTSARAEATVADTAEPVSQVDAASQPVAQVEAATHPVAQVETPAVIQPDAPTPTTEAMSTSDAVSATAEAVAQPVEAVAAQSNDAPTAPETPAEMTSEAIRADAADTPEPVADPTGPEPIAVAVAEQVEESGDGDPRLTALGLTAAGQPGSEADLEPIDALSEATIAARLGDAPTNGSSPESTTSVVVVGLVSVASVAAFKRTLSKLPGVRSVGVSSGPEGEFVFKTVHDADLVIKDVVPDMPGFGARVVAAGEGVVNVSARDPEAEG